MPPWTNNGTVTHPDLEAEQAYIDIAYRCLEESRTRAQELRGMVEVGRGGTTQARYERDVIEEKVQQRLGQLQLGSASLIFGRIDNDEEDLAFAFEQGVDKFGDYVDRKRGGIVFAVHPNGKVALDEPGKFLVAFLLLVFDHLVDALIAQAADFYIPLA